jgi:hypothetical protein
MSPKRPAPGKPKRRASSARHASQIPAGRPCELAPAPQAGAGTGGETPRHPDSAGWQLTFAGPPPSPTHVGEFHWFAKELGFEVMEPSVPPVEPSAEAWLRFAVTEAEELCAACRGENTEPYLMRSIEAAPFPANEPSADDIDNFIPETWCVVARALEALTRKLGDLARFTSVRQSTYSFWGRTYPNAHLAADESLWKLSWAMVTCLGLTKHERAGLVSAPLDKNQKLAALGVRIQQRRITLRQAAQQWPAEAEWEAMAAELAFESARAGVNDAKKPATDASATHVMSVPEMLSAPDLAQLLGRDVAPVESFLRRFRKRYPDCFREVEGARRNEPKYLYRTAIVLPALQKDDSQI